MRKSIGKARLLLWLTVLTAVLIQPAEATWESLKHEPAEWLLDAKFGIYTHWGVYSVPAFQTEWYAKRMYEAGSGVNKHHIKTYGDPKQFGYHKFVPLFKAEKWDPTEWAQLMKATGAKYAGMAVVHHDGFLLWDSDVSRWNAKNMGPKRDCYGEYVKALRNEGLKTIATFHHIRTFNWYLPGVGGMGGAIGPELAEKIKAGGWDLTNPEYADLYWNEPAGCKYEDFLTEWQAKVREVVDKYRPDVLWFDGGSFRQGDSEQIVLNLLAYYHNRADGWGKSVEVLNKLPVTGQFNFPAEYGILTFEEGRDRLGRVERPWIDDMKISNKAWCYVEGQKYKSANAKLFPQGRRNRTGRAKDFDAGSGTMAQNKRRSHLLHQALESFRRGGRNEAACEKLEVRRLRFIGRPIYAQQRRALSLCDCPWLSKKRASQNPHTRRTNSHRQRRYQAGDASRTRWAALVEARCGRAGSRAARRY